MDWTAIGSMAAIAAVAIALVQYRHSVQASKKQLKVEVPTPEGNEVKIIPKIHFRIQEFGLDLDIFDALKVDYDNEKWDEFNDIRKRLGSLHIALITIENRNNFPVFRMACEIGILFILLSKIQSIRHLARSAINLTETDHSLQIRVDEIPAGEKIAIICAAGSVFDWKLNPLNAAVEFVTERRR